VLDPYVHIVICLIWYLNPDFRSRLNPKTDTYGVLKAEVLSETDFPPVTYSR